MKIELHLLQSFAPSNLNRDDTGNPKDCEFGGFRRARISSQCLKRATRSTDVFKDALKSGTAFRTKKAHVPFSEILSKKLGLGAEQADFLAIDTLNRIAGWDEAKKQTTVLLYISGTELEAIGDALGEKQSDLLQLIGEEMASAAPSDDKKKKKKDKGSAAWEELMDGVVKQYTKKNRAAGSGAEVALFGRMLAEKPDLNTDAACQVAHALSTHKVEAEFDYFTAVDDLNKDDETGAGMIGTVGFNASCFYRYAVVDMEQLAKNLAGDRELAAATVEAFVRASVAAIPSGKQNTFAAQNMPSLVMAVARPTGSPWSLANAFVNPVRAKGDKGLVEASVEALDHHWDALTDMYGLPEGTQVAVKAAKDAGTLNTLAPHAVANVEAVTAQLNAWLAPWKAQKA